MRINLIIRHMQAAWFVIGAEQATGPFSSKEDAVQTATDMADYLTRAGVETIIMVE